MRFRVVNHDPKIYVVVFETGDELASGLLQFANEHDLASSSFTAIGAFSAVKLGWFDWDTKTYTTSVDLDEQVELLSMIGDVALADGKPQVHAHIVVGRSDGSTRGGHLQAATVRPTCEVVLTENPTYLQKECDPESRLALIRP